MKTSRMQDMQVPIEVVLGRGIHTVGEIAGIGEGTIIELDQVAGEPVELVAAGETIARGEVVVIDENFGIRVTKMVHEAESP